MKFVGKILGLLIVLVCTVGPVAAQVPENIMTESGEPLSQPPVDDVVENTIVANKRVLAYDIPREADIFWKKRVWRVLDIREKMNLPFAYPERPFFTILLDAVADEENPLRVFSDETFETELDTAAINAQLFQTDTLEITDPETYETTLQIIRNDIDVNNVQRYRLKEVWFFDKESSTMQVRILGIAPLMPIQTELGGSVGERPLFWVYYPEARQVLAREKVFNEYNDANLVSWEDVFEMRFFSSYIYKVSNVKDLRLQDQYTGRELLMEAEKLEREIFNFEHDLWSY